MREKSWPSSSRALPSNPPKIQYYWYNETRYILHEVIKVTWQRSQCYRMKPSTQIRNSQIILLRLFKAILFHLAHGWYLLLEEISFIWKVHIWDHSKRTALHYCLGNVALPGLVLNPRKGSNSQLAVYYVTLKFKCFEKAKVCNEHNKIIGNHKEWSTIYSIDKSW